MNQILDIIKQNKKIVIALGVVLVIFLAIVFLGNRGETAGGFFNTLSELNQEPQYNGTIDLNIGDKEITMDVLKNGKNYVVSVKVPASELTFNDLLVKQDGTLYLNSGAVSSNGGIIAVRAAQESKDTAELIPTIISALSSAEITCTDNAEAGSEISVSSSEEWSSFFTALNTALTDNVDAVSAAYKNSSAVKGFINEAAKDAKKAAETDTVANTITASIKTETVEEIKKYTGNFEFTADFSALPEFVNPEDFDSNQLKITGSFTMTVGETSTAKPVGAVYDANEQSIVNFFYSVWENIFKKEEYVALNEVTVTSSSVYNKYDLGDVIEESHFTFNKDGVESADWVISTTDQKIINSYKEKYDPSGEIKYNEETGVYNLVLIASEDALVSLNKIGTTPDSFGRYLKTAKGGEIIV